MKTMDEVIKAFSEVNKEVGCGDCIFNDAESDDIPCELNDCIFNDALHYLKEYKNTDENYKKAIAHVIEVIDHYEKMVADYLSENNPVLTWDELKLMGGKPLWVEEYYYNGQKKSAGWWLVDTQDDEQIVLRDQAGNPWYAYFISMGTDWKAYRKERE